jgi:hypothetical protein
VVTLAHNTIGNNTAPTGGAGGVRIVGEIENVYIASNNFWDNSDRDLSTNLVGDPYVFLRNNNIQQLGSSVVPDVDIGNISVEPVYEPCGMFCIDRVPVTASPLIDGGYAPGVFLPWNLSSFDVIGRPRVAGESVDIGAYEGTPDVMFRDRFED